MYNGIEFNTESGVMAHQGAQYPYYSTQPISKSFDPFGPILDPFRTHLDPN